MSKEIEVYVDRYIKGYHAKIERICEPLKRFFGINYLTYHSLSADGMWRPLVSRPDWADFYTQNQLFLIDPLQVHPRRFKTGTLFWSHYCHEEKQKEALKRAEEDFSMSHGLCLIERKGENCEFFGFTAPLSHHNIYNTYLNNLPLLQEFCRYFKDETASILKMMQDDPINLGKLKGAAYEGTPVSPFDDPLVQKSLFLKCIDAVPPYPLSKREKECLSLYLDDLRMQDVANYLNLSVRTIEAYLNSIKNKLGCNNKTELIQKGRELRLLGYLQ